MPTPFTERLRKVHQEHLLAGWDRLSPDQQAALARQIDAVDFELLARLVRQPQDAGESPSAKALRAQPPAHIVRLPQSPTDHAACRRAADKGENLLRQGRVGAILVAGGQGTRLGFDQPKGMYPIGPVSRHTLFQLLAAQLLARGRRAGKSIPYYIMTSDATHEATLAYFRDHDHCGLDPHDVHFFQQGTMPAVDAQSGRVLLAAPGQLATSPDGHGGMLAALERAGLLDDMARRGIDYLYYHQVDNPLAIVCDPAFLGWHVEQGSEVSTKVVAKTGPEEKMGLLVDVDGQTQIIEYSDMPAEVAARRTADGELELWAGSTAIHVFDRAFLDRVVRQRLDLPFHLALKKVPYIDEQGALVQPAAPNACKFERFIFDILPHARRALVVEASRDREFNPVKNASGVNSPDDVQRSLVELHAGWLRQAGISVPDGTPVEISPLFALDAEETTRRMKGAPPLRGPTFLQPADD